LYFHRFVICNFVELEGMNLTNSSFKKKTLLNVFIYILGARNVEIGDLTARRGLRKDLQCKSFRWYLENIYPESQMPLDYYYLGEVRIFSLFKCKRFFHS
jgi:hypothetical protein